MPQWLGKLIAVAVVAALLGAAGFLAWTGEPPAGAAPARAETPADREWAGRWRCDVWRERFGRMQWCEGVLEVHLERGGKARAILDAGGPGASPVHDGTWAGGEKNISVSLPTLHYHIDVSLPGRVGERYRTDGPKPKDGVVARPSVPVRFSRR